MAKAEDLGQYYRVHPDMRDLNYGKFFEEGELRITQAHDYNSQNTHRLDVEGTKELLMKLEFMRDLVAGTPPQLID